MSKSVASVRFQFFIAFGLIAIVLWGAIAFALQTAEREDMARASADGHNLARSLAEHVASSVRAIDLSLKALCDEWLRDPGSFDSAVARHQAFLKDEAFIHIAVIGADGRLAWDNLPGWRPIDLSDRQHFKIHKQRGTRELYISEPMLGRVSKQWTIQFTRPIYDRQQKFAGVLVLSVPPPVLGRVYKDIKIGEGARITLVRSDGQILAHSRDLAGVLGVSLADAPGLGAKDPPAGEYRRVAKVDGVERLYRYQKVSGYPLAVFIGQSVDTVLAPYRVQRAIYLASGALATVLLLALMLLLVSRRRDKEKADNALRISEQRFRSFAELGSDWYWEQDADFRFTFMSGGVVNKGNFAVKNALGKTRWELPIELDEAEWAAHRAALEAHRAFTDFEYEIVTDDGSARYYSARGEPLFDDQGRFKGYRGTANDITARKRSELALRESEDRFRDLARLSSDWFWEQDASFRFTAMSDEVYAKAQLRPRSTIGKLRWELPIVNATEEQWRAHREVLERHESFEHFVYSLVNEAGDIRWFSISGKPLFGQNGEFCGYRGTGQDITERKRAEQEIRRLSESLEQKVEERTRELARSNDELAAFSYSVAHDLRTPLRGINGFSAILASEYADKLDAAARDYLRRIQAASVRMGDVMDDLLALAHAGRAELKRQEVDLSALAQAVAASLESADPRRRVEFVIASGIRADADPGLVRIALDNLLGNAWKFSARTENARIEFGLSTAEGKPAYFVRDNGIGFDPAFSGKLFEQFQRLHTDKEYDGTGVGLAIVARVIRRHGGRIRAEGALGQGATFFFTLG